MRDPQKPKGLKMVPLITNMITTLLSSKNSQAGKLLGLATGMLGNSAKGL